MKKTSLEEKIENITSLLVYLSGIVSGIAIVLILNPTLIPT